MTTTVTATASLTCRRRWRRTICVSIFISSLPKKSTDHSGVSLQPSPSPMLPDVVLSVPVVAEQVTSRTSCSKSRVAIDFDETEHESLKNTLVRIVQPLPKKSSDLPGVSPWPSPPPTMPDDVFSVPVAEQVTSRTSCSKSRVAIDFDETGHESLKKTLVRIVQPLPNKSTDLPGVSPPPSPSSTLPDVVLSLPVVAEQVTSRTSCSKSRVAIDFVENEHESLKKTLVRIVQPLPKNSSDLPGVSPPPSPSPTLPKVVLPSVPDVVEQVTPSRTSSSKSRVVIDIDETEHEELKNKLVRIVQDTDLDSLRAFGGGIEGIASVFGSDLLNGIYGGGREREELLNIKDQEIAKGFVYFLLQSCNNYTIFLLLFSSGLCFSIDLIEEGPETGWHDGVAVLFAVFLLVMCPSVANFRRARKLEEKLVNKKNTFDVEVVRGGMHKMVTISNIVEGDIVRLNGGDRVPADGLLVDGDGLVLDEVLAPSVNCDHNPFLLSGSKVITGQGRMLVTSVCPQTALTKVVGTVVHDPKERTLLEARIDKPIAYTDKVALGISVVISLALLLRLLFGKHDDNDGFPELKSKVSVGELMKLLEEILLKPRGKIGILTTSLTAVVIGLQHGMPFVITVSISYWKGKKVSDHASLQNSSACGTMGLVSVLCIDVTGGFMCKEMEVNEFWIGEMDVKDGDEHSATSQVVLETLSHGINLSALVPNYPINQLDNLLISWAKSRWGLSMEFLEHGFELLDHRKICSNRMGSGVLTRKNGVEKNTLQWHCKGEASAILGMCSHYSGCRGETYAMDNVTSKFEQMIEAMEDKGLIPIAYAYKQLEEDDESREDGLNLLAIVGFKWPCQEEFKSTVVVLRNAGVVIKLVSSDKLFMVRALACELGLFKPGSNNMMLEGEQFQELDPDQRTKMLDEIQVMANFLPTDKFLMVECLKQRGHVVAFFGGLTTSDTPTLKLADVGITEETHSTEMAREISDIIISDKGWSSLTRVSKTGRCVYHNIQKFIQLQLIASISGILITFISTVVSGKSPISVIQLAWLNMIMCILGGLMLILKPRTQELTTNQPSSRNEPLITKIMWKVIIAQVLYQAVVLLIFQFNAGAIPRVTEKVKDSMIFNSFILCQIFNQLITMDLKKKEPFKAIHYNCCFLVAVGAVAGVHFLMVNFVACLADCVKLNWIQWTVCFIIALLSWGFHLTISFIQEFFTK